MTVLCTSAVSVDRSEDPISGPYAVVCDFPAGHVGPHHAELPCPEHGKPCSTGVYWARAS